MKKLERRLGLMSVISISIGSMLGSGIFVLPGVGFEITGPSLFLAFLLSAITILPAAISKSELASAMPTSGGTYVYVERTFGPLAGTVAGLGLYLSVLLKTSFALVGFAAYLDVIAHVPIQLAALLLLMVIVAVNILGVGKVSSFVAIVVGVTLISTVGLIGASFFEMEYKRFDPLLSNGLTGLMSATGLVFVAFAGVTKVAAIAEEIKNPGKNLPRGILISLFLVTAVYCSITFVLAGNLPMGELIGNLRPIHTLAEKIGGPILGLVAVVISVLTMTSVANAGLLAASRFPFAMGRDHLLPSLFGKLSERFLTPIISILVSGVVVASAIIFLDVVKIAKLASVFMILIYMIENIAVIVLRETRVQWYKPVYKSIAYPFLQLFGIITGLALLGAMGGLVPVAIVGISVPGILLYFLYSRKKVDRRGVLGVRGTRKDLVDVDDPNIHPIEEVSFTEEANVVVAMFGNERSPEVLTEMGLALAEGTKLEVVHMTEVPEQTVLDDIRDDDTKIRAIRRRVHHMSTTQNANVRFDPIVSHDIMKTVNDISQRLHCQWLVTEWGGRTRGAFTLHNPMGWLRDHLSCHLMTFRDKGVRYFKKIMVIVDTEKSNQLLLETAEHLSDVYNAEVTLVCYVEPNAESEVVEWKEELLEGLKKRCPKAVATLKVQHKYEWQAYTQATDEFDLVIFEAEKVNKNFERFFGSTFDKVMEKSACSVVSVQPIRL